MRICLIGITHPSHNPRLVREADTLVAAGHDVRVVAPSLAQWLAEKDQRLMASRHWRFDPVDIRPTTPFQRLRSRAIRGRRWLAYQLFKRWPAQRFAPHAYATAYAELVARASREPADWYIAHTQPALPIAVEAASRHSARVGFDCEDLLSDNDPQAREIILHLERHYLPRCDYITAASQGMADMLVSRYMLAPPTVLYNVFPRALAKGLPAPADRPLPPSLRLHWFSQLVGPNRGLEDVVRAAGFLGPRVELWLRGGVWPDYRAQLEALAAEHSATLHILPQIDHDDLIRSMEAYDVGLALEQPGNLNYELTVTNKFFSYLLAGMAVAATATPGQREALALAPEAGFTYQPGDVQALATGLRRWLDDPAALRRAQQHAWEAAHQRLCWDHEQAKFLHLLDGRTSV